MNQANAPAVTEQLLSIDAPHFYCGLVLSNDRVVRAAPIVRYMVGWPRRRVEGYCRARNWRIETVGVNWRHV